MSFFNCTNVFERSIDLVTTCFMSLGSKIRVNKLFLLRFILFDYFEFLLIFQTAF